MSICLYIRTCTQGAFRKYAGMLIGYPLFKLVNMQLGARFLVSRQLSFDPSTDLLNSQEAADSHIGPAETIIRPIKTPINCEPFIEVLSRSDGQVHYCSMVVSPIHSHHQAQALKAQTCIPLF
ncbi:hypothetical protein TWF751_001514 [Orbilia oligospora]|nr:hypothetical protein TWF751_001514 [Orbilia oligospora]